MPRPELIASLLSGCVLPPAATWRRLDNAILSVSVGVAVLILLGMVGMTSEAWARPRQNPQGVAQPGAKFPYKSHFVTVYGSRIHYVEEGKGDPILLIHGNPSSSYMWRNVIPFLKPHGRVIAMDLIGFGKSEKPNIEYRFIDHYRYLEGFIEQLKLRNLTLVLHDWGSALGFYYASQQPDNVKAIAFFEALLMPLPKLDLWPQQPGDAFRAYRTPTLGWHLIVDDNEFIEKRVQEGVLRHLSKEELDHYRTGFEQPQYRKPLWRWSNELPIDGQPADVAAMQMTYLAFLGTSAAPKLMLYAKPGVLTPEPIVEWSKQNIKNLEAVYVGEGLHHLQEDHPAEIGKEIAQWIERRTVVPAE
jgi:haloalkane dehalogenase